MEVEVPVMAPSEEIVAVHEAPPPPAPMASAGAALPDKALDTSPSPSPPPTTPTPPAAAAPLFRKGQSVWYASTPKTSHDALVLEDAAAGAATVRIRFNTNRFVEDVPVARRQAGGRGGAPPPAGGDDDWLVEGSPWIGTRLMRTVFDFDAHAAATKADVAFEPQSLASREGRAGGARKVAVDQCACVVVGWLPADRSDFLDDDGFPAALYRVRYEDAELAGDVEDLEEHELEECQGQPKDVDELEAGAAADYDAVLAALRTVDVTVLTPDLRRNVRLHERQEVRSIPIGAIGRGAGGTGVRVSEETRDRPRLARLLAAYGRAVLPESFLFTSIQVNANYRSAMHCDGGNVGASAICAFGDFTGGNLWTHDRGLLRVDGASRGAPRYFNGNMPHMTMPFDGERYSLIYFCCGNWGSSYERHKFPTPKKAFEYEYGFQIHEDHIIEAALTNYSLWRDRFRFGDAARDAATLDRACALQRRGPGADVSDVPLGGCVLYCERRPRSEAFVFGVFYDDGDFEELSLSELAGRGPPAPYVVYEGEKTNYAEVVGGHHMAALGLLPPAPAPVPAALGGDREREAPLGRRAVAAVEQVEGRERERGGPVRLAREGRDARGVNVGVEAVGAKVARDEDFGDGGRVPPASAFSTSRRA
ncbi:acetylcholine-gated cation-selective channel [Aureococcus anophagefferens]|nr:acetylcholine-gated cation-selective channel [Aureococcus anophagefferens]